MPASTSAAPAAALVATLTPTNNPTDNTQLQAFDKRARKEERKAKRRAARKKQRREANESDSDYVPSSSQSDDGKTFSAIEYRPVLIPKLDCDLRFADDKLLAAEQGWVLQEVAYIKVGDKWTRWHQGNMRYLETKPEEGEGADDTDSEASDEETVRANRGGDKSIKAGPIAEGMEVDDSEIVIPTQLDGMLQGALLDSYNAPADPSFLLTPIALFPSPTAPTIEVICHKVLDAALEQYDKDTLGPQGCIDLVASLREAIKTQTLDRQRLEEQVRMVHAGFSYSIFRCNEDLTKFAIAASNDRDKVLADLAASEGELEASLAENAGLKEVVKGMINKVSILKEQMTGGGWRAVDQAWEREQEGKKREAEMAVKIAELETEGNAMKVLAAQQVITIADLAKRLPAK